MSHEEANSNQVWLRRRRDGSPSWTAHYQPGVPHEIEMPDESLVSMVETACRQGGSKIATDFFGATINYRSLGEQINRAAEGLRRLGVNAGDRVALALPNCPQHLIAFHAIMRLGAVAVEHNPRYTANELQTIFEDHGARYAIVMDTVIDTLNQMPSYARPSTIISVDITKAMPAKMRWLLKIPFGKAKKMRAKLTNGAKGNLSWENLLKHRPIANKYRKPKVDDLACIQYTSGTTGRPRGVMLTHRNLFANARQGEAWMFGAKVGKEVNYAVLPMFHAFGMTLHLTFGILKQSRQVLFPVPDVEMILTAAGRIPPTIFCVVPAIYQAIAEKAQQRGIDLSSARFCISGAMALIDSTRQLWESVSGGLLVEGYGLTEASPVALGNPFFPGRKSGTIGVPFPSTQMRVVDPSDPTREVEMGESGELLLKGPQVFQGYWNDPDATADVLVDGWLRTGDIVQVDDDGFVTIVDRKKEIIITGGFNVSPTEVEKVLIAHEAIRDIAVVGCPTGLGDEEVVAVVIANDGYGIDSNEIRSWAKERLAAYKVPRRFVQVDDLPRSILGKVLRGQVRADLIDRE